MLRSSLKRRSIGLYFSVVILVIISIVIALIMYKYHVEGEKNLPFNVTEIFMVSTAQTTETMIEEEQYKSEIIQKNDIYITIEKNDKYKKDDIIKKINFDNFKILSKNEKGITNIYKPAKNEKQYDYTEEYIVTDGFEYLGDISSDTKADTLKIGNQGGTIKFSIATLNLGSLEYLKDEELEADGRLLNKIGVLEEDIEKEITFCMTIELESGLKFKSNLTIKIPLGDILTEGVTTEKINVEKLVFKR